jgi:hypothetical protein
MIMKVQLFVKTEFEWYTTSVEGAVEQVAEGSHVCPKCRQGSGECAAIIRFQPTVYNAVLGVYVDIPALVSCQ